MELSFTSTSIQDCYCEKTANKIDIGHLMLLRLRKIFVGKQYLLVILWISTSGVLHRSTDEFLIF